MCMRWRIQDFPKGGAPTPKSAIIFNFFAENCMKMKEFGPPGGARPWHPPWIRLWYECCTTCWEFHGNLTLSSV